MIARVVERLEAQGVSVTHLQQLAIDDDYLTSVATAILQPDTERERLLAEYGEVPPTADVAKLRQLLADAGFDDEDLVKYGSPEQFRTLLPYLTGIQSAALVLFYGIGIENKAFKVAEIAERVNRSGSAVNEAINKALRELRRAKLYVQARAEGPVRSQD
ncbi:hypothetical protein PV379_03895 [Streptomyces caniscabiei]|uniref:hypothetical protein n=1 Tax=Streptomyces caniscabiei TaxID=2746961 RepID=UPI0029B3E740|nr:hypothetical protein [Streptomyces caniscabiei]MDX2776483.1 hypothetical protein [Streptomyces caniscabiei]